MSRPVHTVMIAIAEIVAKHGPIGPFAIVRLFPLSDRARVRHRVHSALSRLAAEGRIERVDRALYYAGSRSDAGRPAGGRG